MVDSPTPHPTSVDAAAIDGTEPDPLGNHAPLLSPDPLGQSFLSPKFITPLGATSLLRQDRSTAADYLALQRLEGWNRSFQPQPQTRLRGAENFSGTGAGSLHPSANLESSTPVQRLAESDSASSEPLKSSQETCASNSSPPALSSSDSPPPVSSPPASSSPLDTSTTSPTDRTSTKRRTLRQMVQGATVQRSSPAPNSSLISKTISPETSFETSLETAAENNSSLLQREIATPVISQATQPIETPAETETAKPDHIIHQPPPHTAKVEAAAIPVEQPNVAESIASQPAIQRTEVSEASPVTTSSREQVAAVPEPLPSSITQQPETSKIEPVAPAKIESANSAEPISPHIQLAQQSEAPQALTPEPSSVHQSIQRRELSESNPSQEQSTESGSFKERSNQQSDVFEVDTERSKQTQIPTTGTQISLSQSTQEFEIPETEPVLAKQEQSFTADEQSLQQESLQRSSQPAEVSSNRIEQSTQTNPISQSAPIKSSVQLKSSVNQNLSLSEQATVHLEPSYSSATQRLETPEIETVHSIPAQSTVSSELTSSQIQLTQHTRTFQPQTKETKKSIQVQPDRSEPFAIGQPIQQTTSDINTDSSSKVKSEQALSSQEHLVSFDSPIQRTEISQPEVDRTTQGQNNVIKESTLSEENPFSDTSEIPNQLLIQQQNNYINSSPSHSSVQAIETSGEQSKESDQNQKDTTPSLSQAHSFVQKTESSEIATGYSLQNQELRGSDGINVSSIELEVVRDASSQESGGLRDKFASSESISSDAIASSAQSSIQRTETPVEIGRAVQAEVGERNQPELTQLSAQPNFTESSSLPQPIQQTEFSTPSDSPIPQQIQRTEIAAEAEIGQEHLEQSGAIESSPEQSSPPPAQTTAELALPQTTTAISSVSSPVPLSSAKTQRKSDAQKAATQQPSRPAVQKFGRLYRWLKGDSSTSVAQMQPEAKVTPQPAGIFETVDANVDANSEFNSDNAAQVTPQPGTQPSVQATEVTSAGFFIPSQADDRPLVQRIETDRSDTPEFESNLIHKYEASIDEAVPELSDIPIRSNIEQVNPQPVKFTVQQKSIGLPQKTTPEAQSEETTSEQIDADSLSVQRSTVQLNPSNPLQTSLPVSTVPASQPDSAGAELTQILSSANTSSDVAPVNPPQVPQIQQFSGVVSQSSASESLISASPEAGTDPLNPLIRRTSQQTEVFPFSMNEPVEINPSSVGSTETFTKSSSDFSASELNTTQTRSSSETIFPEQPQFSPVQRSSQSNPIAPTTARSTDPAQPLASHAAQPEVQAPTQQSELQLEHIDNHNNSSIIRAATQELKSSSEQKLEPQPEFRSKLPEAHDELPNTQPFAQQAHTGLMDAPNDLPIDQPEILPSVQRSIQPGSQSELRSELKKETANTQSVLPDASFSIQQEAVSGLQSQGKPTIVDDSDSQLSHPYSVQRSQLESQPPSKPTDVHSDSSIFQSEIPTLVQQFTQSDSKLESIDVHNDLPIEQSEILSSLQENTQPEVRSKLHPKTGIEQIDAHASRQTAQSSVQRSESHTESYIEPNQAEPEQNNIHDQLLISQSALSRSESDLQPESLEQTDANSSSSVSQSSILPTIQPSVQLESPSESQAKSELELQKETIDTEYIQSIPRSSVQRSESQLQLVAEQSKPHSDQSIVQNSVQRLETQSRLQAEQINTDNDQSLQAPQRAESQLNSQSQLPGTQDNLSVTQATISSIQRFTQSEPQLEAQPESTDTYNNSLITQPPSLQHSTLPLQLTPQAKSQERADSQTSQSIARPVISSSIQRSISTPHNDPNGWSASPGSKSDHPQIDDRPPTPSDTIRPPSTPANLPSNQPISDKQLDLDKAAILPPGVTSTVRGPRSMKFLEQPAEMKSLMEESLERQAQVKSAASSRKGKAIEPIRATELEAANTSATPVKAEVVNQKEEKKIQDIDYVEVLAREIYLLLRQRIEIDRERSGSYYSGRFP